MNKKLDLFLTFLKVGAFTFGGGYAMVPLIHAEIVEKKKWITDEEMMDIIAIAESTPGPIAINTATFVGYKVSKTAGSIIATSGVVIPSLIVIILISLFFENFLEFKIIAAAFTGIRAGVAVLIFNAALKMYKKLNRGFVAYLLISISFALSLLISFRFMSLILIVFGAIVGVLVQLDKSNKRGEE